MRDRDRIKQLAESIDIDELILAFDVDFDVPLGHEYALGLLRMRRAFEPVEDGDELSTARRVGAHWCAIVRSDLAYDHWEALRLIDSSQKDAGFLRDSVEKSASPDEFVAYAVARWLDGVSKIHYRLGSYTRAMRGFEGAASVARKAGLWWCLPDILSNVHRGRYEASKQSGKPELDRMLKGLREELEHAAPIDVAAVDSGSDPRHREYARGRSSLLHNLALGYKDESERAEKDGRTGPAATARDQSIAASQESMAISERLGDLFRISQSLLNLAMVDKPRARELFERVAAAEYLRGRDIARERLATMEESPADAAAQLRDLLNNMIGSGNTVSGIGTGVHLAAYAVELYSASVAKIDQDDPRRRAFEADVRKKRFAVAESVRRAVALPAYKQAYARAVRPSYLELIEQELTARDDKSPREHAEVAFGLVEESSARELLDMLSTADLPLLPGDAPARHAMTDSQTAWPLHSEAQEAELATQPRRGPVTRLDSLHSKDLAWMVEEFVRRETEFEDAFLDRPLEASPHDPEIAHRVQMYTVNHPGTCVVRYFTYGPANTQYLGAFVFRGTRMAQVTGIPYGEVSELATRMATGRAGPSPAECRQIWRLLVEPLWPHVVEGGEPDYLVIIPTDDVFAVPVHVAWEPGTDRPLAARLRLAQSVSATAFVARGRNLLRTQPVSLDDDLAAIVVPDAGAEHGGPGINGRELLHTGWPEKRMLIAGRCTPELRGVKRRFAADASGLAAIASVRPEFFVYAGHGNFIPEFGQYGPFLQLPDEQSFLTQYDIALRLRLPRNRLTVLGACLAGQGVKLDGGEVGGFLRSLIAAGAGAIGVPLWSVQEIPTRETVRGLLAESRRMAAGDQIFDVVETLHRHYAGKADLGLAPETLIENLPIALYL